MERILKKIKYNIYDYIKYYIVARSLVYYRGTYISKK